MSDDLTTSVAGGGVTALVLGAIVGAGRWLAARGDRERDARERAALAEVAAVRELAGSLRAERDHERAERSRERDEARATVAGLGARIDALTATLHEERLRTLSAIYQARTEPDEPGSCETELPLPVRTMLTAVSARPVDELLRAADAAPVEQWPRPTTPPQGTPTPRLPRPR